MVQIKGIFWNFAGFCLFFTLVLPSISKRAVPIQTDSISWGNGQTRATRPQPEVGAACQDATGSDCGPHFRRRRSPPRLNLRPPRYRHPRVGRPRGARADSFSKYSPFRMQMIFRFDPQPEAGAA